MRMRLLVIACVVACLLQASENIRANSFDGGMYTYPYDSSPYSGRMVTWLAGPASDQPLNGSMGQFTIVVNPLYQGILQTQFQGYGNYYSSTSKTLTSAILYDPTTKIARSATVTLGMNNSSIGGPVGDFPYYSTVSSGDVTLPPGFSPQTGANAVFTAIQSLNLQSGNINGPGGSTGMMSVTAGTDLPLTGPAIPNSYGEVFSNNASPGAQPDFPASSFFNVFVNVSLPFLGSSFTNQNFTNAAVGGSTATPLIVMNSAINSFPPSVIYYHGNTSAVPIYFSTADTSVFGATATAGAEFGILELAGHGMDLSLQGSSTVSYFQTALSNSTPMPILPQYASWAPGLTLVSGLPTWVSTTSGPWGVGTNWSTSAAPNGVGAVGVLNHPVGAPLIVTLDSPVTVGTFLFGNSGDAGYVISGSNALTLDNGGTAWLVSVGGSHDISTPITLAGNLNVSPSGGSTITLGGIISESSRSSLILSNNGRLTLSRSNNYSGGTTVEAGTLQVGNSAALGTGGLAVDAGSVDMEGFSVTVPSFSGAAAGIVAASGGTASPMDTLTVNQTITTTFGGTFQQAANGRTMALAFTGPGTLILTGFSSFKGGTTVSDGALIVENSHAIADGTNVTVGNPLLFAPVVPDPPGSNLSTSPAPEPGTAGDPRRRRLRRGHSSANPLTAKKLANKARVGIMDRLFS